MKLSTLIPCPKCGGKVQRVSGVFGFKVICTICGNSTDWLNSMPGAVDAWCFQTKDERFREIMRRSSVYA